MTTRYAKIKRFAGMAVMATAVTAVGLGLGSGTAQANTTHPCAPPHRMVCNQIQTHVQKTDNFFDRVQGVFRVGEGTRFDNRVDRLFGVK
ncbi:MAG: hypothetical protein QOF66_6843 [Mycobacterium sp.]|jgi:hypothetical protein|nr:hypothetical protein [Mycobacterium sp.]